MSLHRARLLSCRLPWPTVVGAQAATAVVSSSALFDFWRGIKRIHMCSSIAGKLSKIIDGALIILRHFLGCAYSALLSTQQSLPLRVTTPQKDDLAAQAVSSYVSDGEHVTWGRGTCVVFVGSLVFT